MQLSQYPIWISNNYENVALQTAVGLYGDYSTEMFGERLEELKTEPQPMEKAYSTLPHPHKPDAHQSAYPLNHTSYM